MCKIHFLQTYSLILFHQILIALFAVHCPSCHDTVTVELNDELIIHQGQYLYVDSSVGFLFQY